MTETRTRPSLGPLDIGVVLLTIVTAGIHILLFTRVPGTLGTLFLVDGIVYLVLLGAALFAPQERIRALGRLALLVWTVATIVAWVVSGLGRNTLGYIDKVVELALAALLAVQLQASRRSVSTRR